MPHMPDNIPEICVVEDDLSAGRSLQRLIETLGYSAHVYNDPNEFLREGKYKNSACVLLDVMLPGLDGLKVQELLGNEGSAVPVVFLTGNGDVPMSVRAIQAGAIDFLLKPIKEDELIQALARAIKIAETQTDEINQRQTALELLDTLTPREREVFRAVLTGAMNKQIAGYLGIAEKTVKIHRGHVMQKLRARTIIDLVNIASLCGISADAELRR